MTSLDRTSERLKAISDPTRLRIIQILSKRGGKDGHAMICVNALAARLNITQSAVSQHLKILRQAGIVRSERRGYFIHYGLNQDQLNLICRELQDIAGSGP